MFAKHEDCDCACGGVNHQRTNRDIAAEMGVGAATVRRTVKAMTYTLAIAEAQAVEAAQVDATVAA